MQVLRLRVRLDAQLAAENFRARLELLDGVEEIAALHVQTHERAMDRLLENVDAKRALRGDDGVIDCPAARLQLQQLRVRAKGHAMQTVALSRHPLIQSFFVDLKSIEKIAAVKLRRFCKSFFGSSSDERLERPDIALHHWILQAE